MSDWQLGDLALCIDAGPTKILYGYRECDPKWTAGLRLGAIYEVDKVVSSRSGEHIGLRMKERVGGVSTRFVKVTPPAADELDREVIEQMNGAPVGEPVA